MLHKTGLSFVVRLVSVGLLTLFTLTLLVACGDNTATTAPVATTAAAAATTAPAATTAVATTVAATTAVATTSATTAVSTTAAGTTIAVTTSATGTTVAATSAAAASGGSSTNANCPKTSLTALNFGAIPDENAAKVLDNTKAFAASLSTSLCIPVKVFVGNNYTAVIEALSSAKIDAAIFGPFSYVLAADKYGAKVIAMLSGLTGATSYNSLIITKAGSPIKSLQDLKGHTFSFVDPASTSGNLIPRYTMTKAGLDPDKDVKGTFAGGHDVSLLGVISGKTDAGAVASDVFANLVSQGKVNQSDVAVINTSDPIPNSPVAVRKDLSDADTAVLKSALLNLKDPAALKAINTGGFIDNSNSNYNTLRDVAKILNLDLTKLK